MLSLRISSRPASMLLSSSRILSWAFVPASTNWLSEDRDAGSNVSDAFVDLTPERALRMMIDRSCADHKFNRKSIFEVSAVETMLQFVAAGLGVSIVPLALAKASERHLELHILPFRGQRFHMPKWKLALIVRSQRQRLPGKTVLDLMLEAIIQAPR